MAITFGLIGRRCGDGRPTMIIGSSPVAGSSFDEAMRGGDSDTVARRSGDEFVICAALTDDHPGEAAVRERIEATMNTGYQLGDVTVALSAGIGSMVIAEPRNLPSCSLK